MSARDALDAYIYSDNANINGMVLSSPDQRISDVRKRLADEYSSVVSSLTYTTSTTLGDNCSKQNSFVRIASAATLSPVPSRVGSLLSDESIDVDDGCSEYCEKNVTSVSREMQTLIENYRSGLMLPGVTREEELRAPSPRFVETSTLKKDISTSPIHLAKRTPVPSFPNEIASCGAWKVFFDSASGRHYFYNARTGLSQWEAPVGDGSGLTRSQERLCLRMSSCLNGEDASPPPHSKRSRSHRHHLISPPMRSKTNNTPPMQKAIREQIRVLEDLSSSSNRIRGFARDDDDDDPRSNIRKLAAIAPSEVISNDDCKNSVNENAAPLINDASAFHAALPQRLWGSPSSSLFTPR